MNDIINATSIVGKSQFVETLQQEHPSFNALYTERTEILYHGIGVKQRAQELEICTPMPWEDDEMVANRVQSTAYVPLASKHLNYLASLLFDEDLSITEGMDAENKQTLGKKLQQDQLDYYNSFFMGCDRNKKTSISQFMYDRFITALNHTVSYTLLDFPENTTGQELNTYLDQEVAGMLNGYLCPIDPCTVIDWKYLDDQPDELEFIKLKERLTFQPSPYAPKLYKYRWTIWSFSENGYAQREVFLSSAVEREGDLRPKDSVQCVLTTTSFPLLPVRVLQIPLGLAIGQILTDMSIEQYQRGSWEKYSTDKACVTYVVAKLASALSGTALTQFNPATADPYRAVDPQMTQDGDGLITIGNEDNLVVVEATGSAISIINQQNRELEERMASVVNQVAKNVRKNKQQSSPQSGAAQEEERHELETLLETYAKIMRDYIKNDIMKLLSFCRGENVRWNISGLCTKVKQESIDVLALAEKYPVQSDIFNRCMQISIANRLCPDMSQADENSMRDEIGKNPIPSQQQTAHTNEDDATN